jgi:hypothetical protein
LVGEVTNWILVIGFIIVVALQLVQLYVTSTKLDWLRAVLIPWFVSISKAVNPDHK